MPAVLIGTTDTTAVYLGDYERQSWIYILGKPRTGKSWLLVQLIAQDIRNGHGVFFLDPHGSAIADLLARHPVSRPVQNYIYLYPENETAAFGINLFACSNIANLKARNDTYTKAKGVLERRENQVLLDQVAWPRPPVSADATNPHLTIPTNQGMRVS